MYRKKTYQLGDHIEIEKYHYSGDRKGPRGRREKPTAETMATYNQKQRERKLQRIILANFAEGDFHMTLSYAMDQRPESMEEAKKRVGKFVSKMRREYRKREKEFKAIWVTERGKKGSCHHHMIVENTQELMELVRKHWSFGHTDYKPLYSDGQFAQLAAYITKKETKEEKGCLYSHTRNLIIPEPKVEKIQALAWRQDPKPPKGFEIVSLENGVNIVTGQPFQRLMLRRKETGGG